MLRVAIGQAYHLKFDPKLWDLMQPYAPLGSLYAARVARDNGCEVYFHDSMLSESVDDWARFLEKTKPDLVVLQEDNFNYLSKMCLARMREAAARMIEDARSIGAYTVVGGSDVTDHPEYYLNKGAHLAMQGESERTLVEVVRRIIDNPADPITALRGTAEMESSRIIIHDRQPVIKKPDVLGYPAWDLVDLERYKRIWFETHGYYSINMVSTRGCPYSCNWCAKPIWGQGYQSRTPEDVVAEMVFLRGLVDPDHIWFMDDIFGLKPRWIKHFAEVLNDRDIHIPFKCLSRADLLLRPGEVKNLAASGCETVWMGAESGSQKILDAMDKGITVDEIEQARQALQEVNVKTGFFIQFGYPGEGLEEIRQTLALLRRTLPDDMGISVSYPLPGTKFFENVKHQLREQTNWADSNDLAMLFDGPFPTYFYRCLHKAAHADLNLFRSWKDLHPTRRLGSLKRFARVFYRFCRWLWFRIGLLFLATLARSRRAMEQIPDNVPAP